MHVHNSLLNVTIHMPCVNMYYAGRYQWQMDYERAYLTLIAMGNTLH